MSKRNDWSGAEKYGVGVLAGCLHEKLTENILSLINSSEQLLEWAEKMNPEVAEIFRDRIKKARNELLTQID